MKGNCLIVLAVVCLGALASVSLAAENPVLGEWVPVSTTKGGLGGTRTFETNGTVVVAFGAALNLKYKVENSELVLSDETSTPVQSLDFTITGTTLTLTNSKTGKKEELTRVKGSEGKGLVGKWIGDHYTGQKQIMHFTTNMNCYLSVPFQSVSGSFSVVGDTLTEEFPNEGKTEWKWEIAEDVFTLTKKSGNKTEKYKRKK
jgi:hypothetical protein